jgi:hypothetical protein
MANSITVTLDYTPATSNPAAAVGDSIATPAGSSLRGAGDATGASTDAVEPNQNGGTNQRQRKSPVPPGSTFNNAKVVVTLDCPDKQTITLEATGNVSASGRIEGNCIHTTAVSTATNGRVTETQTVTQKKCCGDKQAAKKPR